MSLKGYKLAETIFNYLGYKEQEDKRETHTIGPV
jgi:hypothetical protein